MSSTLKLSLVAIVFVSTCLLVVTNPKLLEWQIVDSKHSYIIESKTGRQIIGNLVLEFESSEAGFFILQQASSIYECEEGYIATEIKDSYHYWFIDNKLNIFGPYNEKEFHKFTVDKILEHYLSPLDAARHKYSKNVTPLVDCNILSVIQEATK